VAVVYLFFDVGQTKGVGLLEVFSATALLWASIDLINFPVSLCLLQKVFRYKISTLLRAQGVVRRNFKLDLRRGLLMKQRILSNSPIFSQPIFFSSSVRICSSFTPCSGSLLLFIVYLKSKNSIVASFLNIDRLMRLTQVKLYQACLNLIICLTSRWRPHPKGRYTPNAPLISIPIINLLKSIYKLIYHQASHLKGKGIYLSLPLKIR